MYYDILKDILLGFITSFIYIYIWISLINNKKYNQNIKIYILYLIVSVILFVLLKLNLFLSNLLLVIILVPILRILFNENINICLITLLLSQIINIVSSLLFKIIFNLFIKNLYIFDIYSERLLNLYVLFLFTFIITKSKYFKRIVETIYDKLNINKSIFIIILTGSILFLYNYTSTFLHYKFSFRLLILLNIFIIIIYIKMIYKFAFIKKEYNEVSDRYINIISSLKEYEAMIDKYRVLNHENKNQLLTIRAMILKSENDIPKYIDTIIDTTIKDNEKLMFETNVIPSGGLRAIIYSTPVIAFFLTSVCAPFIEEIVFRKAFKDAISSKWLFILTSGIVFGALHVIGAIESPYDFLYIIPYSALGIAFANKQSTFAVRMKS